MSIGSFSLAPGTTFADRYEVLAPLGEGGFGAVFKAKQRATGQMVALKIMRVLEASSPSRAASRARRFLRETELCAQLNHPNIVQLIDAGQSSDGRLYTVFSFVPGDTLAALLGREGALAPREAKHLMLQVLDALACAHSASVVHRDLKPGNIMIIPTGARRNALVLDFGIGAFVQEDGEEGHDRLTATNETLGTPGYAAPEQWRAHEATPRADLFSWGLVFLECLTGRPVYSGAAAAELIARQISSEPVPIPAALERHPLGDLLRRATRKDVAVREGSARNLLLAVDACDLRGLTRESLAEEATEGIAPHLKPTETVIDASRLTGLVSSERRQVTAVCCNLGVRLEPTCTLGAEQQEELLRSGHAACAKLMAQGHGRLVAALGENALFYFGVPRAEEDDAHRAARAALAFRGEVRRENERLAKDGASLEARIGVHTGLVVTQDLTRPEETDLVVGATARRATSLAHAAEPLAIAVSSDTQKLLRAGFELDLEPERTAEGTQGSHRVYHLRSERLQTTFGPATEGWSAGLIGREQEMALLLDRWHRSSAGTGQCLLVTGEPGIGKSRLARELRDRIGAEPHLFLECRCSPDTRHTALYPVTELLGRALGLDRGSSPEELTRRLVEGLEGYGVAPAEAVPLLAPLLSLPLVAPFEALDVSPQKQKELTLNAILALFFAMAEASPALVVVEDLHWADPTTLDLLAMLVREAPSASMCVFLTARHELSPSFPTAGVLQMQLNRLDKPQIEALIAGILGRKALPPAVLEQVANRTDGVPLFVEELTRMMLDSGVLTERADHYELSGNLSSVEIPSTLRGLLTARLDRLGHAKDTAQLAAALGREFSMDVLAAVSTADATGVQEDVDALIAAGLMFRRRRAKETIYIFKHALVRDAAYESLAPVARQKVHARIAATLEERFPALVAALPDRLAGHLTEAGEFAKAIPYWMLAGQVAARQSANLEAVQHFERAIALLETLPETPARAGLELGLRLSLSAALSATQGYAAPAVGAGFGRARELCDQLGDSKQLFPVLWGLGAFHAVRAELDLSLRLAERVQAVAERENDPALLVPAHLVYGGTHLWRGELPQAREHFERGLSLYVPAEHAPLAALYSYDPGTALMAYLGLTLWFSGHPEQAAKTAREAVARTKAAGHAHSYVHSLTRALQVDILRGEGAAALPDIAALIRISEDKGFPLWRAAGVFLRGQALCLEGRADEGVVDLRAGHQSMLETGTQVGAPEYLAALAEAHGQIGQFDRALELADEGIAIVNATGAGLFEASLLRVKAELILQLRPGAEGEEQASELLETALRVARRQHARSWEARAALSLARLRKKQGMVERAREILASARDSFEEGETTSRSKVEREILDELAR